MKVERKRISNRMQGASIREISVLAGLIFLGVAGLCAPGVAAAETGHEEVALGDEQAELYRQAMDSIDGSNQGYDEAQTLLEAALVVGDESELLWLSLGRVHQLAGDCSEAVEAFARSEQVPPTADVDPEEAEANRRDYRAEMGDECDGVVYFDCLSDHTELMSDDIDGLRCGEEIDVEPGAYRVEAALGQVATTVAVDVDPGATEEVFVGLQPREGGEAVAEVEDADIDAEVADPDSTEEVRQSEEIAASDQPGAPAGDESASPDASAEVPAEESAAEIKAEPVDLDGGQIAWSTMRPDVVDGTATRGRDKLPDTSGRDTSGAGQQAAVGSGGGRSSPSSPTDSTGPADESADDRRVPSRFDLYTGLGYEAGEAEEFVWDTRAVLNFWYLAISPAMELFLSPGGTIYRETLDSDLARFSMSLYGRAGLGSRADLYAGAGIWMTPWSSPHHLVDRVTYGGHGYVEEVGVRLTDVGLRMSMGDLYAMFSFHLSFVDGYVWVEDEWSQSRDRFETLNPMFRVSFGAL